jgi:integrase
MRPLAEAACAVLRPLSRGGEMVFPAPGDDVPIRNFTQIWQRVANWISGLPREVTPHVLRHSLASVAADLNFGDADQPPLSGPGEMLVGHDHAALAGACGA